MIHRNTRQGRRWNKGILFILIGIAILAVPFLMRYKNVKDTDRIMKEFEEEVKDHEKKTTNGKKKDALLSQEGVIGIIEIKSLDLKYPIFEGAAENQLGVGIGHLTNTAGLCEVGNCVLAGHNGSRRGVYFTYLCNIQKGDKVKITNKKGVAHQYQVDDMKVVQPNDDTVTEQSDTEELTLFTCAEHGTKRFMVRCSLMGGEEE